MTKTLTILAMLISALPLSAQELQGTSGRARNWHQQYTTGSSAVPAAYFYNDRKLHQEYSALKNRFFNHPDLKGSEVAVSRALAFFVKNKQGIDPKCKSAAPNAPITNREWIIVTDYTKPADQNRQYLINIKTGRVIAAPAAHGYGSNQPIEKCPTEHRVECRTRTGKSSFKCNIPVEMGNKNGSGKTSRGFFLTGDGYKSGVNGFCAGQPACNGFNAVRLEGLQGGVNDNAFERGVVWHRAAYAGNSCSSSAGCPAIPPDVFEEVKNQLTGGALVYLHTIEDTYSPQPDC